MVKTTTTCKSAAANAEAESDDVTVQNSDDPSKETGIEATSKAVAEAEIDQEIKQKNENSNGGADQSNNSEQNAAPLRTDSIQTVQAENPQITAPETPVQPVTDTTQQEAPTAAPDTVAAPDTTLAPQASPVAQDQTPQQAPVALVPLDPQSEEGFVGAYADADFGRSDRQQERLADG